MKIAMEQSKKYRLDKIAEIEEKMTESNAGTVFEAVVLLFLMVGIGYFAAHIIYYLIKIQ